MRIRLPLLAIAAVTVLAGGASVSSTSAPRGNPQAVKPLMFQLEGKLLDAICPDAMPHPVVGLDVTEPAVAPTDDDSDSNTAPSA